jgi:hypothetical protein
VVDYEDVDGVADAIDRLLCVPRAQFEACFESARRARGWEQCAAALVRYCQNPYRAPDKVLDRDWAQGASRNQVRALEQEIQALKGETERLGATVAGYERGRFIRFMHWLHRVRHSIGERFG